MQINNKQMLNFQQKCVKEKYRNTPNKQKHKGDLTKKEIHQLRFCDANLTSLRLFEIYVFTL